MILVKKMDTKHPEFYNNMDQIYLMYVIYLLEQPNRILRHTDLKDHNCHKIKKKKMTLRSPIFFFFFLLIALTTNKNENDFRT